VATGRSVTLTKPAGVLQAARDGTSLPRGPDEAAPAFAPAVAPAQAAASLSQGRVRVTVAHRDPHTLQWAPATVLRSEGTWSLFAFGDLDDPQVLVKVLDFGASRPYLALHAGPTDAEYAVTYAVVPGGGTLKLTKAAGAPGAGSDATGLVR